MCEYFLLIRIDVPSFKLIQGQIKELQGVVPSTPWAENDQKKPEQDRFKCLLSTRFSFTYDKTENFLKGRFHSA